MTFPIRVQPDNGRFTAVLLGSPDLRAEGETQLQAIAALRAQIEQGIARGELLALEVQARGVTSLAGRWRDDPALRDICDEAYQLRNSEPPE